MWPGDWVIPDWAIWVLAGATVLLVVAAVIVMLTVVGDAAQALRDYEDSIDERDGEGD